MIASLLETVFKFVKLDIKARLRAMTVSAVLTVVGLALLLTALGFGVALLYVWLQQMLGTIVALAIIGGACLVVALILFALAAWRPKPGNKPAKRAAPPPPPPRPESASGSATDRLIEEAVSAMQQGSREQMLAALSLALVTGIILGRKA
ncbi:MAG: phage holin family protein [Pseudolabrys sp.]|jgi:type VI protein secretion system component VasK